MLNTQFNHVSKINIISKIKFCSILPNPTNAIWTFLKYCFNFGKPYTHYKFIFEISSWRESKTWNRYLLSFVIFQIQTPTECYMGSILSYTFFLLECIQNSFEFKLNLEALCCKVSFIVALEKQPEDNLIVRKVTVFYWRKLCRPAWSLI